MMKRLFLLKKQWIMAVVLAGAVIAWFVFRPTSQIPDGIEIAQVVKGGVVEIVSESGYVLPTQSVDLAFIRTARIVEIPVGIGTEVEAGAILMRLEQSEAAADLNSARARLEAEQVRLEELQSGADKNNLAVADSSVQAAETAVTNAQATLANVIAHQDQLVQNAQDALYSSDLQAYLVGDARESSQFSYGAPVISGTYASTQQGTYNLSLYSSGSRSGLSFRLSGLENDAQAVSAVTPIPLGTRGLYVQFPEDFARNTEWEIPIPNVRSNHYQTNLNAYTAAKEARSVAITSAENTLKTAEVSLQQAESQYTQVFEPARAEQITAQRAAIKQAQAAVEVAQIAYDNTFLRAPFAGIITAVDAEIGELVTPSHPSVSLIATQDFELLVNVSESDIRELTVGDTATVTFDAFDDLSFNARVSLIAPSATLLDGVRIFEVRLQLIDANELIRSGISADVDILTAEKRDVIAVPSRAVVEKEEGKFVRTLADKRIEYIPVKTGLRGSNGMTEIISGLSEGQSIITFADEDALKMLEAD